MNVINPGAAEVPHRQIAELLRARIRRGDWAPGERLPSIPDLARSFGVAKNDPAPSTNSASRVS